MQNSITCVGMDVHAETIVLAAVRGSSDAIAIRAEFPNTPKGRERLAGRLAENVPVRCVYEAGPCGHSGNSPVNASISQLIGVMASMVA